MKKTKMRKLCGTILAAMMLRKAIFLTIALCAAAANAAVRTASSDWEICICRRGCRLILQSCLQYTVADGARATATA